MKRPRRKRPRPDLLSAVNRAHADSASPEMRALLHELQVHTEEITVQNEELVKAQHELEVARDRYADLYDFAPVGYVSLDHRAVIAEINIQGAVLLGRPRAQLVGFPFPSFVTREHREALRDFLAHAAIADDGPARQGEFRTKDQARVIRLVTRPQHHTYGPQHQFIAMMDVTEERRLEVERQATFRREQARAVELSREIAVRMAAEERIKALLERLVNVQEEERRRLALNLHDQLGQQLTALKLTVGALKEKALGDGERHARLDVIESIVSQLDRDVDFLAWELRPAALDEVGLEAALTEFLRQWSATRGIVAEFHGPGPDTPRLAPELESHLYRIAQEALNNVAKHANAHRVSMLLERHGDEVVFIVEDDGCGFDPDHLHVRAFTGGMGLSGMRERAAAIGGTLEVESAPGKGTTLFIRAPFKAVPAGSGR